MLSENGKNGSEGEAKKEGENKHKTAQTKKQTTTRRRRRRKIAETESDEETNQKKEKRQYAKRKGKERDRKNQSHGSKHVTKKAHAFNFVNPLSPTSSSSSSSTPSSSSGSQIDIVGLVVSTIAQHRIAAGSFDIDIAKRRIEEKIPQRNFFRQRAESYLGGAKLLIDCVAGRFEKKAIKRSLRRIYNDYKNEFPHYRAQFYQHENMVQLLKEGKQLLEQYLVRIVAELQGYLPLSAYDNIPKCLLQSERLYNWQQGRTPHFTISQHKANDKSIYALEVIIPITTITREQYKELTRIFSPDKPKWFTDLPEFIQQYLKRKFGISGLNPEGSIQSLKQVREAFKTLPSTVKYLPGLANFSQYGCCFLDENYVVISSYSLIRSSSVFPNALVNNDDDSSRLCLQNVEQILENCGADSRAPESAAGVAEMDEIEGLGDEEVIPRERKVEVKGTSLRANVHPLMVAATVLSPLWPEQLVTKLKGDFQNNNDTMVKEKERAIATIRARGYRGDIISVNRPVNALRKDRYKAVAIGEEKENRRRTREFIRYVKWVVNDCLEKNAANPGVDAYSKLQQLNEILLRCDKKVGGKRARIQRKDLRALRICVNDILQDDSLGKLIKAENIRTKFKVMLDALSNDLYVIYAQFTKSRNRNKNLYDIAYKAILTIILDGVFHITCKSGKDRTGIAIITITAMLIYQHLSGCLPKYDDDKVARGRFVAIFCRLLVAGIQLEDSAKNAKGCYGLKSLSSILPADIVAYLNNHYPGFLLNTEVYADLNKPSISSRAVLKKSAPGKDEHWSVDLSEVEGLDDYEADVEEARDTTLLRETILNSLMHGYTDLERQQVATQNQNRNSRIKYFRIFTMIAFTLALAFIGFFLLRAIVREEIPGAGTIPTEKQRNNLEILLAGFLGLIWGAITGAPTGYAASLLFQSKINPSKKLFTNHVIDRSLFWKQAVIQSVQLLQTPDAICDFCIELLKRLPMYMVNPNDAFVCAYLAILLLRFLDYNLSESYADLKLHKIFGEMRKEEAEKAYDIIRQMILPKDPRAFAFFKTLYTGYLRSAEEHRVRPPRHYSYASSQEVAHSAMRSRIPRPALTRTMSVRFESQIQQKLLTALQRYAGDDLNKVGQAAIKLIENYQLYSRVDGENGLAGAIHDILKQASSDEEKTAWFKNILKAITRGKNNKELLTMQIFKALLTGYQDAQGMGDYYDQGSLSAMQDLYKWAKPGTFIQNLGDYCNEFHQAYHSLGYRVPQSCWSGLGFSSGRRRGYAPIATSDQVGWDSPNVDSEQEEESSLFDTLPPLVSDDDDLERGECQTLT